MTDDSTPANEIHRRQPSHNNSYIKRSIFVIRYAQDKLNFLLILMLCLGVISTIYFAYLDLPQPPLLSKNAVHVSAFQIPCKLLSFTFKDC